MPQSHGDSFLLRQTRQRHGIDCVAGEDLKLDENKGNMAAGAVPRGSVKARSLSSQQTNPREATFPIPSYLIQPASQINVEAIINGRTRRCPLRKSTTRRCGPQQRMSPYATEKCSVNKTKSAGSPPTISEQYTKDISAILRSYVTKLPKGLQSKAFDAAGKFVAILELTSNTPSNSFREPQGKNQGRIPQTTENPEPPKSNNDNGVVFSKDAPLTLLDFSQHLGLHRAERLVADISAILQILPDRDPVGLPCQFQFNRSGLWVGEWINLVVQHCPQVFQLSDHYLKNSALVNLQNIHQLLESPTPNDLQFAESLFLRVAEGFLKPGPLAKNGIAHTVFAAMIVAATKAPFNSLPESLSCYVKGTFYESFVTRVKSIVTAIQALRDSKRNKLLQLSALACFMVAGVVVCYLGFKYQI
ncbi:hypothetical protein PCANC_23501 [Puccinia coronata f. sp. avenae]|uniref:Uncharacterized protein n=1 Tax=Puccinia coronata f. sp. avenae TaxID=200324 RepID=A0A2N5S8U2_9BASI|nr:hypothetical protein PCANC_23501 [Puccinia coronata f. sp. avenae]